MLKMFCLLPLSLVLVHTAALSAVPVDPECNMTTPQLIQHNGYRPERYFVTTTDGYILQIFRIKPKRANSPVVFLQHGLIASSDCWLLNGNWGSFPFILSDQGYDVWLGNVRGNVYSLNHTTIPVHSDKFWDFSFQEMAEVDLPAMVDQALAVSGQKKLFYVGHSQGTEMGFIGFSQNKELANKILLFSAFAPIARVTYVKGLLGILKWLVGLEGAIYRLFGNRQFDAPTEFSKWMATQLCPEDALTLELCETWDSLLSGFDISNINQTRFPIYEAHADQGTSTKDIIHWAQLVRFKQIQKFDYGSPSANMARYNQTTPPIYNISNLAVPTVLVSGGNDWLADTIDVAWLTKTIHPAIRKLIYIDKYSHDDFTQGMDAPELVYRPVMQVMEEILTENRKWEEAKENLVGFRIGKKPDLANYGDSENTFDYI